MILAFGSNISTKGMDQVFYIQLPTKGFYQTRVIQTMLELFHIKKKDGPDNQQILQQKLHFCSEEVMIM